MLTKLYHKICAKTFGNRIGLINNIIHSIYHLSLKLRSTSIKKIQNSDNINQNGYHLIKPNLSSALKTTIKNKLENQFSDKEFVVDTHKESGMLRLKDSLLNIPEVLELLRSDDVSSVIKSYFDTDFYIHNADIYRTFPVKNYNPNHSQFDSLKWHFDNAPRTNLKVMIYLTDTTKENGAITIADREISKKLCREGFWDRNNISKDHLNLVENNHLVVESGAFTVILFTPQFNIHKATLPFQKHRDVAVFLLYPGEANINNLTDQDKIDLSRRFGYMKNPLTKSGLRVSYE